MGKFATIIESSEMVEALKKIGQHENGNKKATVHRDVEWDEYRVKLHRDGKHEGEASDYHTTDKQDAHDTAKAWVNKAD